MTWTKDHPAVQRALRKLEVEIAAIPDPDKFITAKATLWGPAPWGGTLTADLESPALDSALQHGYTVHRTWQVWQCPDGRLYSEEIS